eukprot:1139522-Prorocentrum_minimum.AAC.3
MKGGSGYGVLSAPLPLLAQEDLQVPARDVDVRTWTTRRNSNATPGTAFEWSRIKGGVGAHLRHGGLRVVPWDRDVGHLARHV